MLLVVGSGGLLGRHAAAYFSAAGKQIVCASHRPAADIYLDLRRPGDIVKSLPSGISHALICSSVTNIDACRRDKVGTRRFNVKHTVALLQTLLSHEIQPIFCSTDAVFRGDRGNYKEDDARQPTMEYGRQKKEVEDFLLHQNAPFLIIRMSKLYSLELDDPSPIGQMANALVEGTVIRCADDQVICPTWVGDIPPAVNLLLEAKATGVYHMAAPQRYTRYTLGIYIAKCLGLDHLVQRCSIRDFAFAEPRPVDSSLDVTKFLGETGFTFSGLEKNLSEILSKHVRGVSEA